jgi:hypothetical protein
MPKPLAQHSVLARDRMHVSVDQAGVEVALGLDHLGVGRDERGVGRFVAFMRQRQTGG